MARQSTEKAVKKLQFVQLDEETSSSPSQTPTTLADCSDDWTCFAPRVCSHTLGRFGGCHTAASLETTCDCTV